VHEEDRDGRAGDGERGAISIEPPHTQCTDAADRDSYNVTRPEFLTPARAGELSHRDDQGAVGRANDAAIKRRDSWADLPRQLLGGDRGNVDPHNFADADCAEVRRAVREAAAGHDAEGGYDSRPSAPSGACARAHCGY
jgi:hypothetical protein